MSNPYLWQNKDTINNYSTDPAVASMVQNYGRPTTDSIKAYTYLGDQLGYAQKHRKMTPDVVENIQLMLEANKPLHVSDNPLLSRSWQKVCTDYKGTKTGVPLYGALRSKLTKELECVPTKDGAVQLYQILHQVTQKPPEVHHLLYKSKYPSYAIDPTNLVLVNRSESEKKDGPSQHELLHIVSSGNDQNKFKVIQPYFEETCKYWMKK